MSSDSSIHSLEVEYQSLEEKGPVPKNNEMKWRVTFIILINLLLFKALADKILSSQGSNKDSHDKDNKNITKEEEVLVADG